MLPSSTNSSTLSESACSALDKPSKSPACRPETTAPPPVNSGRRAVRIGFFALREAAGFDGLILLDCFFLTAFRGAFACFLRTVFFSRFAASFDDFVCFFLVFLEGSQEEAIQQDETVETS